MNRSTRSAAAKVHQEETEDNFMEDGFSVVDSDKSQKGKDGDSKNIAQGEESQNAVGNQEGAPMETDQGQQQQEIKENGGGNGNDASSVSHLHYGKGISESVTDAPNSENVEGEDGKPAGEPKEGEEGEGKPSQDGAQEGTNEENKEKAEDGQQQEEGKSEKKPKHPVVWVSNISRHVKATDLKKHFSKYGKVVTAKIVTNGKNFFGYVCLDSLESAEVCVKNLNNSDFDGKKISVTVDKPVRDDKILRKGRDEAGGGHPKDPLTTVYDEEKKEAEEKRAEERKKHAASRRKVDTSKMSEEELRKEVALCEREIDRLRTRLIEEQARCRGEIKRARRLERELGDADAKIREDRKRYDRDREEWVKKNRLEQLRLDADRVILEREKEEMRRAREEFERDLRRFLEDQQRAGLDRPRGQSPHNPAKRFRADDTAGDVKSPWINDANLPADTNKGSGYFRDGGNQNTSRGSGQFFGSGGGGGGGWSGSQGGSQWRNIGGGANQQPYFRNDTYRPGGFSGTNDSGPAFRGGPFENTPNRKF